MTQSRLPLRDVRVLDLSRVWAGPFATRILGSLGAQVIKIESPTWLDPLRGSLRPKEGSLGYPSRDPGRHPWNRNGYFNSVNLWKLGLALELSRPEGRELFLRMVAIGDVVIENFKSGTMERLGLSYAELRKHRPDIIYVSMPAFGNTGPWKQYLQYGIGQEMIAGISWLTGYRGGSPQRSGVNLGDPWTGLQVAAAVLLAVRARQKTGRGTHLDVSQYESSVTLLGEELLDTQRGNTLPDRLGSRDRWAAPHGMYPTQGTDRWIAIEVWSNEQWLELCQVLGRPEWGEDSRFGSVEQRKANEDVLDQLLGRETRQYDRDQLAQRLQGAGVCAAPVMNAQDIFRHPHYKDRRFLHRVEHSEAGRHQYPRHVPYTIGRPHPPAMPAPTLGQHNRFVLETILGLALEAVEELEQARVIADVPCTDRQDT